MRSLDPVERTRVGAVLEQRCATRAAASSVPCSRTLLLVTAAAMSTAVAGAARADTVVVDGRANIFGAGRTVAPDPGSAGPGLLPTAIVLFDAPERLVTFDTVSGLVSAKAVHPWWNGADGGPYATGNTDILSYAGISGIKHDGATMFLVGVFTDGHEPVGDAPVRLDATLHTEALVISPLLFQTFFIGDGRTGTGSGSVQVFNVPHGARMLYLGFADAYGFGDPIGLPGSYDDNGGELHVTFTIVPAPGVIVLAASGAALILARRRHRT